MGLADLTEPKKFSMIQIIVYVVVFLLAGYLSYTFIVSKEVKKLRSAQAEYKKEKIILKALEERAQSINAIANNAQKLETELIGIRSRVFNEENDILGFMRTLPATTNMTGNNLMSITPSDLKPILEAEPPPPSSEPVGAKTTAAQSAPRAPQNLPCKIKPVEVSFVGGYGDVIRFFDELKKTGQYVKVDNISLVGAYDTSGQVNVKVNLNLLQMGVDVRTPQKQIAELAQKTGTTLVSKNATTGSQSVNIANPIQTPTQATVAVKPVQKVAPVQIAKLPQTVAKPTATAVKTVPKVAPIQIAKLPQSVAKPTATAVKTVPKVAPIQIAKLPQTVAKPTATAVKTVPKVAPIQIAKLPQSVEKPTAIAVKPVQKVAPIQIAKLPQSAAKPMVTAAKQPQFVEKPLEKVESKPPVETAKQSSKIVQYAVRVGKFSYYENAENLAKTLKTHQYNAWIKPYSHNGKTTYWVYVGSFETKDKAADFAETMQQKLSYIDDFVIMDVKAGIRRNS